MNINNFKNIKPQYYDIVIAIGQNCFSSTVLLYTKMRSFSNPFDWVQVYNYTSVIEILKNKLKNYFDKEYLEFLYNDKNLKNKNDVYKNKLTEVKFIHDFPKDSKFDFDNLYAQIKQKYDRRINRLLQIIKNKKILLVYIEWFEKVSNNKEITNKILKKDIKELNKIYKNVSFDIFYVKHNDKFSINEFEINNRICTVNNTPNGHFLGNLDLVKEIINKKIKIQKPNKLKIFFNKVLKLIQIYFL